MYENRWNLKIERMKKKITLKELSKNLDCSITLISMYENNDRNMSDDKVRAYQKYILEKNR